ncbi:MAG: hypothetical protein ACI3XA_00275 [Clostridia bacterium]
MSTIMICGSPHGKGGNSTYLLEALNEKLGGVCEIYNAINFPESAENAFLRAVEKGDSIVFSFPLYADSLPAHFLLFLRRMEQLIKETASESRIYVIVNNGFYDDFQNSIAIKIVWKWCEKCSLKKGRALAVGAGGMTQAAPIGKGPMAKVGESLEKLSEDIQKNRSGDTIFVKPSFPRFMYKSMGNLSFTLEGKKNGLTRAHMKKCN